MLLTAIRCIAKLHRLMSPDLSLIVDPAKLADSGESLEGQLQLQKLNRISDLILDREGIISFSLAFGRDDEGTVAITGELSTELAVLCQRCLGPMRLRVQSAINVGVVDDPGNLAALPDRLEPVVTEEHRISLQQLIEDELLLAMPLAPVHEQAVCPGAGLVDAHAVKKQSPFAVLKDMKTGKQ